MQRHEHKLARPAKALDKRLRGIKARIGLKEPSNLPVPKCFPTKNIRCGSFKDGFRFESAGRDTAELGVTLICLLKRMLYIPNSDITKMENIAVIRASIVTPDRGALVNGVT